MLVGIMGDSHNNIQNVKNALSVMNERGISIIIHCGDICKPSVLKIMGKYGIPIYCSFGNMDNAGILKRALSHFKNVSLFNIGKMDINGCKIAFVHFPYIAESIAMNGGYDVVFYGHTHEMEKKILNDTILANPGEIAGISRDPSFVVFDTKTGSCNFVKFG